jgi:hypothetical protein
VVHLKKAPKVVGLAVMLALLAPLGFLSESQAQETRVSREGGSWAQEVTGSLSTVRNLRVKVDMGSVVVRGGQQQGISTFSYSLQPARANTQAIRTVQSNRVRKG